MDTHLPKARRGPALALMGLLVAVGLTLPVLADADERPQNKSEATRVAKKMEKAVGTAHHAEQEREALEHFEHALEEYAELHAKELRKVGRRTDPDTLQVRLAHAIAGKRATAQPGDILSPQVQPLFRQLIADQLKGPDALAARKAVLEGNPAKEEDSVSVIVRVNAPYPDGATRSTVPPSVLVTLPALPQCLHYRFVGSDLILVDAVAQLIVDFLPGAAPDLPLEPIP